MRHARARLSQQYEDDHMGWKRYYGYRQTRFSADLQAHMEAWCDRAGRRPPNWNHWSDGLHPKLRDAAEQAVVADSVVLHDSAAHLRSSQAFAFNLFLPFRDGAALAGRRDHPRRRGRRARGLGGVDAHAVSVRAGGGKTGLGERSCGGRIPQAQSPAHYADLGAARPVGMKRMRAPRPECVPVSSMT